MFKVVFFLESTFFLVASSLFFDRNDGRNRYRTVLNKLYKFDVNEKCIAYGVRTFVRVQFYKKNTLQV